jgi:hypothetical protein
MHKSLRIVYALSTMLGLLLFPLSGRADLLPAQNATLTLVDASVYLVVSTPVTALTGVDDNQDGLLSTTEIETHNSAIAQQFQKRFLLTEDGKSGTTNLTMVRDPGSSALPGGFSYVVVLQQISFPTPPKRLQLTTDLFGTNKGEDKLTLQATMGKASDPNSRTAVVILEPGNNSQRLFVGGWETFTKFIRIGVEHILAGTDHLLFLLTIIVAAAGWRYWLSVVTSFTIAHSITLTLSALGTIKVNPTFVEQAIAASIVLMAIHNLLRQGTHTCGLVPLVFGCGLLHGLGFASALSEMGLDSGHRIATLAGFNVGVECGQFVFLIGVIALIAIIRRILPVLTESLFARLASVIAAIFGGIMLIERIEPLNNLINTFF